MSISLQKLIAEKGGQLEAVGIDAGKYEAEMILCYVLDVDRLNLYLHGQNLLNDQKLREIDSIVKKRITREPLQYILEESWFYGRRFYVNNNVMIPTPETELLCEQAINFIKVTNLKNPKILDVGTGSGVIGLTMAGEISDSSVLLIDLSEEALSVAMKNADDLELSEPVDFRQSDMFSSINENEKFDLILSNPPYICETEYANLPPEVLADPKLAITSGDDGMDAIRKILKDAPEYLSSNGRLMFEIGYDQSVKIAELTETDDRYNSLHIIQDYNDIDRIVILSCKK